MPTGHYTRKTKSLQERFEKFIYKDPISGCWLWTGAIGGQGYGQIGIGGRKEGTCQAHRVSWMIYVGPIPNGLDVCHKCDNRPCVNPEHLFTGTRKDNMQDAVEKDRIPKGAMRYNAKLTEQQVVQIKNDKRPLEIIAREYGIFFTTVHAIKKGRNWKHLAT